MPGARELKVTTRLLTEHDACYEGAVKFDEWLRSRGWSSARITYANIRSAERFGVAVGWMLWEFGGLRLFQYHVSRELCLRLGPGWAYQYAYRIDQRPRKDTRRIACGDPYYAYLYARDVDKCATPTTKEAAASNPYTELLYEYLEAVE